MCSARGGPRKFPQAGHSAPESNRGYFFDPWLTAAKPEIKGFCEFLEMELRKSERRVRRRKEKDLATVRDLLKLVLVNLAYVLAAKLNPPAVAVPLAKPAQKRTRYERAGLRHLPVLLQQLADLKYIALRKSRRVGRASTVEPSSWLQDRLREVRPPFRFEHFGRSEGEEIIILSRTLKDEAAGTRDVIQIDYVDTEETNAFRSEMHKVNDALARADVQRLGAPVSFDTGPSRRALRRIFNLPAGLTNETQTFAFGGRCYHGWWQNLDAEQRWSILINGGRIADLDFESMFLRLAYLRTGIEPPAGDLYGDIVAPEYRDGVKQVVNAMLFRTTPLQRLPKGSPGLLPSGCTARTLREAILNKHSPLKGTFETGLGFALMRTESDILVRTMLRLIDAGYIGLPMHDGVMVPQGADKTTQKIMGDVSEEIVGFRLPVKAVRYDQRSSYAPS
ncbi:MAG TPA: hypothetical protein VFB45_06895 [Pseudolabrys sp.]|nr:hypothetical protein [Pseudolabrys sp.]